MHFPKLTPLQSRFAASFLASAVLVILYLTVTSPKLAYAADIDSRIREDHNHPIIGPILDFEQESEIGGVLDSLYEPDFAGFDRSIIGRAPAGVSALSNNAPGQMNIEAGETQNWVFPKEALAGPLSPPTPGLPSLVEREFEDTARQELKKRQNSKTLYITLNTCLQPSQNSSGSSPQAPPQLQLYVSQSSSNEKPGPGANSDQQEQTALGGYAELQIDAESDVFIGVAAPSTSTFSGIWNYEVAASIDAPYHNLDHATNLYFVDSDSSAALLVTNDTTQAFPNQTTYQEWMALSPPFSIFAHNQNDSSILGLQNSFCGLNNYAQIRQTVAGKVTGQVAMSMTNRGIGNKPKEQFYVSGLNRSSTYFGFLAMNGNSTASGGGVVGGGGRVWQAMNFTTKIQNNCAVLFNLSFCSEVAYAVPSNPNRTVEALSAVYDSNAAALYQNFNYSLQQIPCNTTSTAQYSLARNCDDCARAYKAWLCAVTIPRCEDYDSTLPFLLPRNTAQHFLNGSKLDANSTLLDSVPTNSSRNPIIDSEIVPGPYKEVLPCKDLCYDLVQSCPATFGFGCPTEGKGLNYSYGNRATNGDITCSYLGAAYDLNAAGVLSLGTAGWCLIMAAVIWSLVSAT